MSTKFRCASFLKAQFIIIIPCIDIKSGNCGKKTNADHRSVGGYTFKLIEAGCEYRADNHWLF